MRGGRGNDLGLYSNFDYLWFVIYFCKKEQKKSKRTPIFLNEPQFADIRFGDFGLIWFSGLYLS